jgi:Tol biopolymer transport system component
MRSTFSSITSRVFLAVSLLVATAVSGQSDNSLSSVLTNEFTNPQAVRIVGYTGDAMEPFLSRDGKFLFFNNSNDPRVNTNLHWATRIDDLTFQYKDELQGINTSALEGVASMDRNNTFYFVSNRSYDQTASTIYRGTFLNGVISGIELVPGVSIAKPGIVNFDAEITADGDTLYFVESQFAHGQPKTAVLLIAKKSGNSFMRDSDSLKIMEQVNARGLNYAPAISVSQLELFFTRFEGSSPGIYRSSRTRIGEPFGKPNKIAAISGFVEAPTLSPDEKSLYFHKKDNGRFVIYRVTRH